MRKGACSACKEFAGGMDLGSFLCYKCIEGEARWVKEIELEMISWNIRALKNAEPVEHSKRLMMIITLLEMELQRRMEQ
jgi:hypothetical protein